MLFLKTLRDGTEAEMIAPADMKDQILKDSRFRVADDQPPEVVSLIDQALELGVLAPSGKIASRSILERWAPERLEAAVKAAQDEVKE